MANIILIDNVDSFTYNLVDQLRIDNHNVIIYRNYISIDIISSKLENSDNPILIISPGPGQPVSAGCVLKLLNKFIGKIPILGICLGHQSIIETYGGHIIQTNKIIHGKASYINHDNQAMFNNLSNPMKVARYHSLIGTKIPNKLIINAYLNDLVMSVRNNNDKICGFQFHPESILTTEGSKLLSQTIKWMLD